MANTFVQIYLHVIFHIKSTSVQMNPQDLPRIFAYIGGILSEIGSVPIIVGGVSDHIHLATSLPKNMVLPEMMRIVKAKSSKWIKKLSPYYASFTWQDGYGAFSVSPSVLGNTIEYIKNQETHHQNRSFEDEIKDFLNAYQISYDERYLFTD